MGGKSCAGGPIQTNWDGWGSDKHCPKRKEGTFASSTRYKTHKCVIGSEKCTLLTFSLSLTYI